MAKLIVTILFVASGAVCFVYPRTQETAAVTIKRLSPTAFPQLPTPVIQNLLKRGCVIPQTFLKTEPHNVISGAFAKPGTTDWAVLCSVKGKSSILIFWAGAANAVAEIAVAEERDYLQGKGVPGSMSFSRAIAPVSRKYITEHARAYGKEMPPAITHQGIDDAFLGKASVVYYRHKGSWLRLQGAD